MKPPAFDFHRVDSAAEAVERLAELGEDAKLIAGGQSLVPMLAFRLVRPSALVDIGRLDDLRYVRCDGDVLRIGALTRHCALEEQTGPLAQPEWALMGETAQFVGHVPIRARGTVGGSVAHADPAAEWCLLAVLLDGELVVRGPRGERAVPASDFFSGYLTTALEPGEMLVEVRFGRPGRAAAIEQVAARHGDFAVVSAAVSLDVDAGGACRAARIALGAVSDTPVRAGEAERLLAGAPLTAEARRDAAAAAADSVEPRGDSRGSSAYRKQLVRVLVERALERAATRAGTDEKETATR